MSETVEAAKPHAKGQDVIAEFERLHRCKADGFTGDPELINAMKRDRRNQFLLAEWFGDEWLELHRASYSRDKELREWFAAKLTQKYEELDAAEARGGAVVGLKIAASRAELDDMLCHFRSSRDPTARAEDRLLQVALGVEARRKKIGPENLKRRVLAENIVEFADWHNAAVSDRAIADYLGCAHTNVALWREDEDFIRGVIFRRWLRHADEMSPDYLDPYAAKRKVFRPVQVKTKEKKGGIIVPYI